MLSTDTAAWKQGLGDILFSKITKSIQKYDSHPLIFDISLEKGNNLSCGKNQIINNGQKIKSLFVISQI